MRIYNKIIFNYDSIIWFIRFKSLMKKCTVVYKRFILIRTEQFNSNWFKAGDMSYNKNGNIFIIDQIFQKKIKFSI